VQYFLFLISLHIDTSCSVSVINCFLLSQRNFKTDGTWYIVMKKCVHFRLITGWNWSARLLTLLTHTCTLTAKYGQCATVLSIFCIHCKSHVILHELLINLSTSDLLNQPRHHGSYCHIVLLLQIPIHEVVCVYKVQGVLQHILCMICVRLSFMPLVGFFSF
jgi:hypothetical protein